jgi:hypothetical protein
VTPQETIRRDDPVRAKARPAARVIADRAKAGDAHGVALMLERARGNELVALVMILGEAADPEILGGVARPRTAPRTRPPAGLAVVPGFKAPSGSGGAA